MLMSILELWLMWAGLCQQLLPAQAWHQPAPCQPTWAALTQLPGQQGSCSNRAAQINKGIKHREAISYTVRAVGKRNCVQKGFAGFLPASLGRFVTYLFYTSECDDVSWKSLTLKNFLIFLDANPAVLSLQSPIAQREVNNMSFVDAETQCSFFATQ